MQCETQITVRGGKILFQCYCCPIGGLSLAQLEEEIAELDELKRTGKLPDKEYQVAKANLVKGHQKI